MHRLCQYFLPLGAAVEEFGLLAPVFCPQLQPVVFFFPLQEKEIKERQNEKCARLRVCYEQLLACASTAVSRC